MNALMYFLCGIILLTGLDLIRVIIGKYAADRLVAVNALTTKVCIIILLLAFTNENYMYLDIALVFVLCSFVGNVSILRLLLPANQQELLSEIAEIPAHLQAVRLEKIQKKEQSNNSKE